MMRLRLALALLSLLACIGAARAADTPAPADSATTSPQLCPIINEQGERVCPICKESADGKQDDKCDGKLRGRMLDRSKTLDHDAPPNTEQAKGNATVPPASLPFRISVDGEQVDASPGIAGPDAQRRTDVASAALDIQIRYDSLDQARVLNSYAWPGVAERGTPVHFTAYANYAFWIHHAEIRLFPRGGSTQKKPFAVIALKPGDIVDYVAPRDAPDEMVYVYRVYDAKGRFDETEVKPLRLVTQAPAQAEKPEQLEREMLVAYGTNSLKLRNIPVTGGAVTANGRNLRAGQTVRFMGLPVPVDRLGAFAARQILPAGPHHVEVVVEGADGKALSFTRDLSIADKDWFYVALGDLTAGHNNISGPIALVTGDSNDEKATFVDGRGALYLKGRISGEYLLTVAADTQENPLNQLFSNVNSKDPRFLLRNLDPNLYYPVYGDDSTTVLDTPTQGKFYVRLERGESQIMWGNFLTRFSGTEFANYSRGLYGANLHWVADSTTKYGEKSTTVDAFAAQPGTLQSREEYRGTGGSLYYLRNQDVTQGSEQVWVEVRDYISGLVVSTTPLVQQQDYQINYLQGRVVLTEALQSTANASTLVRTGGVSGDPVFLVVTYEYVPGTDTIRNMAAGGHISHWFNDNFKLGATSYRQAGSGQDQKLEDVDATLRYAPGTYLKTEIARSDGPGSGSLTSINGGFSYAQSITQDVSAGAKRVEGAVDLAEISDGAKGRVAAYWQERDAGFSGPGQLAPESAVTQRGIQFSVPLTPTATISGKADDNISDTLTTHAAEINYTQKLTPNWGLGLGLRMDRTLTPLTAADGVTGENGGRTDGIILLGYRANPDKPISPITGVMGPQPPKPVPAPNAGNAPGDPNNPAAPVAANAAPGAAPVTPATPATPATPGMPAAQPAASSFGPSATNAPQMAGSAGQQGQRMNEWDMYGFIQPTLQRDGDRPDNNRVGVGASQQINDRLRVGGEISGGSGGAGGSILGGYQITDRSNVYLSYALQTDRTDDNMFGRGGSFTTGTRYRFDDATSVYAEERATFGSGEAGLVNAFGLDLAPNDRWSNGIKVERGMVTDPTLGELTRNAIALSTAYHYDRIKYAGALEYREETASGARTTSWLMKNSLGYQVDQDWRFLGRLNFATSQAAQPILADPNYVEGVISFAYRPVNNDRWNILFKYTYLENTPPATSTTTAPVTPNAATLIGSVFGQLGPTGSLADYAQKSNVLSVDAIYDVSRWVSIGAKYAIRIGSAEFLEDGSGWYSSNAQLFILRADFHVIREWDAMIEVRDLVEPSAGDARAGALIGIYRHFPEHVKLGVGYNFTNYSDNMTDLSYKSHGWFINMLTTY